MPVFRDDEIFEAALGVPPAGRAAFMDQCADDGAQRHRVEALLRGHDEAKHFLGAPLVPRGIAATQGCEEESGDTIGRTEGPAKAGRYILREKLGEGGCGVVWRAEQREPVKREVALKVIKLGMDTREVIVRFEAERQALALMDHPNIARVFDGGATESGRPYLVMELVRGVPITRYCEEHALTLRQRIELFIAVCEAVQHAHQKGIIHRDLKPSNILVVKSESESESESKSGNGGRPLSLSPSLATPKVIDFGIAKATQGRLTDATLHTALHQFIGTPAYMSPEQVSSADVDTRSDIYSLGVLLYELLTGETPLDRATLASSSYEEIREKIRTLDPVRPSARVRMHDVARASRPWSEESIHHGQDAHATPRAGRPCHMEAQLRGDLDWIVMRCLEKDRARRYESAAALAADLRRHLDDQPVSARPPSAGYTLQKLIRRHRVVFASAAAIAAILVLGMIVSTWQAIRATRAEREQTRLHVAETAQRQRAETQELATRRRAYAADMNLAQQALAVDNLGRARELLDRHRPKSGEPDLRGWEWRYLWQQCRSDASTLVCRQPSNVNDLAASADGRWLAIHANRNGVEGATRSQRRRRRDDGGESHER